MIWTLLWEEIAGVTRPAIRVPLFSNSQGFCLSFVGVLDRPMWLGSVIVARNAGWFTVHISDHWRSLFKLARGFRLLDCFRRRHCDTETRCLNFLNHTETFHFSYQSKLVEDRNKEIKWKAFFFFKERVESYLWVGEYTTINCTCLQFSNHFKFQPCSEDGYINVTKMWVKDF